MKMDQPQKQCSTYIRVFTYIPSMLAYTPKAIHFLALRPIYSVYT